MDGQPPVHLARQNGQASSYANATEDSGAADLCQALTEGDEVDAFVQEDVRHLPGHLEIRHSLNEPNRGDVLAIKLLVLEFVRNTLPPTLLAGCDRVIRPIIQNPRRDANSIRHFHLRPPFFLSAATSRTPFAVRRYF